MYVLSAETSPGCFTADTVRITVNISPSIELGPDLNLCDGDNITFSVGENFASYQWNLGDTSNKITVNQPGQYSVVATTEKGCSSYDTVTVLNIVPNPVVNLDQNNNRLCRGSIINLDAGNFSTYLWNDGSTERTLAVQDTGFYSVTVTDNNGCSGYNTIAITILLNSPSDFLPADTTICSNETLRLKPERSYESYLWNTNSTSEAITVSQAGIYILQVTDQNNCTGKDTINVKQKDCMKGCYVPGAFTPNGDGKNDRLRPLLFGNVIRYRFTVYDRSGRIVFQSSNLSDAWDGTYVGSQQVSNAYVWTCTYQFEGEAEQSATGTVIVIR
jgi:gliding motility-associated-like protein